MPNPDHLAILKEGVEAWNRWREEYPGVRPDLGGAILSGAILEGAKLHGAYLNRADLSSAALIDATLNDALLNNALLNNANLSRAYLSRANLRDATLIDATLNDATLSGADLHGATLIDADLRHADLYRSTLIDADLRRADLTRARVWDTIFSDTNLSAATGLDKCRHYGPSTIDYRTLARSGHLPQAFLRGCGQPDWLIEAYKLTQEALSRNEITNIVYEIDRLRGNQPLQFYSCFICYSSKDDDFAKRLHDNLQSQGVRCWFAPEDMKIGSRIRHAIDDAIRHHDKLLIILSEYSVESQWVEGEVETALEKERRLKADGHPETVLFPIRLDEAVMETGEAWVSLIRKTRHIGDFRAWKDHDAYSKSFDRLLRDLRAS